MNASRTININPIWFVIIGFLVILIVITLLKRQYEKKRREALRQVALRLGLEFSAQTDEMMLFNLSDLFFFRQGHASTRKIFNKLSGNPRNTEMAIFDYQYVTGAGKNRYTWVQTVICFTLGDQILPAFSLGPESLWHKIASWFGSQDIDFNEHPGFSKRYRLKGSNEAAVRKLFTSRIMTYFENEKNLCADGAGNHLLFYRQNVRVKPELISAFMEEGYKILALFKESAAFV